MMHWSLVTCTICQAVLFHADHGIRSHLRIHIKDGTLDKEDEQIVRHAILNTKRRS